MAMEVLYVPEEHVLEVVVIIRAGLESTEGTPGIDLETVKALKDWCDEEAKYYFRNTVWETGEK